MNHFQTPRSTPPASAPPDHSPTRSTRRLSALAGLFAGAALLSGCAASTAKDFPLQETFASTETYSRPFDAPAARTCEAARRALLSQGYLINTSRTDMVEGQKSFQPAPESHLQMVIRVVCAPEGGSRKSSLGFVTALQDSYALKKSNNSASLGVGAIGAISLPFSSSNDSMVKIGSETITSAAFYERFFELVRKYLVAGFADADPVDPADAAAPKPFAAAPRPLEHGFE